MTSRVFTLEAVRRPPVEFAVAAGALFLSVAVGSFLVSRPTLAYLPVAALVAVLLVRDGRARLLFVVVGGLLVFQSSGSFDAVKLGFFAGLALAFGAALLNVRTFRASYAYAVAAPLFAASVVFFALIAVSLPVAHSNGVFEKDWLRDVSAFVLFASAPVFALDARVSFGRTALVRLLVAAGMLGALGHGLTWLTRRGVAHLPFGSFGLASLFPGAALLAYAFAATLQGHARRLGWLLVGTATIALTLIGGSRTSLALLVAPFAVAVGARRYMAARSVRLALVGPIAVAATVLLALAAVTAAGGSLQRLEERVSLLAASGDSSKDSSYNDRRHQAGVAWAVFKEHPLVGSGPGTIFEWTPQGSATQHTFVMDTPVTYLAKFGLVGLAVLGVVVLAYASFLLRVARKRGPTLPRLALTGYLAVAVALSVLVPPIEDKGFSHGLILVLALVLSQYDARRASG